jgi:hypothetical protein
MAPKTPGEPQTFTLVLMLVTGQMVTLDANHTRVGGRWLSDDGGLESLEWALSSGQSTTSASRCIVEVDAAGQVQRLFPSHAVVVARVDREPSVQ